MDTFELLKPTMWDKLNELLPEIYTRDLKIYVASLENEAGIIGAALLCFAEEQNKKESVIV